PELKTALDRALADSGLSETILIKETGCLGPCSRGPVMMVDPEGIIYEGLTPDDADRIVKEHLVGGTPVDELLHKNRHDGKSAPTQDKSDFFRLQDKVVLRHCGKVDPLEILDSIALGGYSSFAKALELGPDKVIEEMKTAGIRGRGGAGFPTWLKWKFTKDAPGEMKYVLCNADEGDPGAFMDRSVLEGDPHTIIEGMAIAAFTVGASNGFVYVRAEYPLAVTRLNKALEAARDYGILGTNIMGSGFDFDLDIRMGSGAFVCGEETALIASVEGKRGEPRPRPPFPAASGLWGKPTLINNVETYANVAPALADSREFASRGTEGSKGTKVFALAGSIEDSGLVEVPVGTKLGELIYDIGGGLKGGKSFKAAQVGGPSGGCVPKSGLAVPMDYEALKEWGAIMGSGGLIVMDDDACMVDVARFFLEFVQEESCGKCVPCRVGTKRMLEILERIGSGRGEEGDIEDLLELGQSIKDTALCGLGQTAPNPVLSAIRHFREEFEEHIRDKHCAAGVCPGLVRASCQSACPAAVDVPGFVSLVGEGRYAEALKLHRERNPFASVCARVCFHTCEDKCRRSTLDDAVAIRSVKRYLVDQEVTIQLPELREDKVAAKKNVAIVGAGPSGLSCAYFLARLGYKPTVYEAAPRPGGMLVQTIPAYRLPRETLAREIRMIENMGTEILCEKALGKDFTLPDLRKENDAVYLSVGAPGGVNMGLPGEDALGVVQAVPFLSTYNLRGSVEVGKNVVIIGGGNAAVDAARTALRLGAESVTVVYRRSREEMPAYAEEVDEALQEGVVLRSLLQPIEISTSSDGRAASLVCLPMHLGEFDRSGRRAPTADDRDKPIELPADQIILAIGQRLDSSGIFSHDPPELNSRKFIKADPATGETSIEGVWAGGDAVDGPSSVVSAIAAGERAAVSIDAALNGGEERAFWRWEVENDTDYDPDADPTPYPREKMRVLPHDRRKHNFDEVEQPWAESVARRQARRCLRCDYGKKVRMKEETHA
ncbi:MAG: NADH-ubiquinone oxidoreductase-F iron-sulfur binding region domain-containing protein, partial [Spirochaetaceae bacterium]|nr:NADH-ubiquinone oxidoreductase-F iron-sulfur binding region domain-containing protein [Spirochaetaceae bacterium]